MSCSEYVCDLRNVPPKKFLMPHPQRITNRDARALLDALEMLYSDIDRRTLPNRTLQVVRGLISGNNTSFDSWKSGLYGGFSWGDTGVDFSPEQVRILNAFISENPVFVESVLKRRAEAIILTDFVSFREFSRTNIYNEFYRKVGDADTQMAIALPLSPDLNVTCQINRKGRNFSERDRRVLNLLAPHLLNVMRNAFAFERLNAALEKKETGIISLDGESRIQFASTFARHLLEKYFGDEKRADNSLPQTLWEWVKGVDPAAELSPPQSAFSVESVAGRLSIRAL